MTTQYGDSRVGLTLGMFFCHLAHGVDEIVHSLALIGDPLRHEKDDFLIQRQPHPLPGLGLIALTKHMRIDRIRNTRHVLAREQSALLGLRLQPSAASHEENVAPLEHGLLLTPYPRRQVVRSTATGQQITMLAGRFKIITLMRIMANRRSRPSVVRSE